MRVCIQVIAAVGLVCAAAGAEGFPGRPASVSLSTLNLPGATRVTVGEVSEIPAGQPLLRLVALPPGAVDLSLRPVGDAGDIPIEAVVGEPMILRGVRVVPLLISAGSDPGKTGPEPPTASFDIRYRIAGPSPAPPVARLHGRGFYDSYRGLLLPSEPDLMDRLGDSPQGGYLIVVSPELLAATGPLAAWKREMGFEVTVATTDETGTRNDEIRDYVRGMYENSPVPPQYLLLVGDVEHVPGFDYHQSVSDLPYSLLDGDDFLPDLEVGRLSAQTSDELDTIVAKILRYEQDPYRGGGDEWFSRALMVAGNYSSNTPVPVSRWCREQLLDPSVGYAEVDSVYYPPHWSTGIPFIRAAVDEGVTLVSYRGWAYGWRGWEPPKFTVDDIPSLSNGWMLPAVFSFVCLNGDFTEPECFGEAWIRAGTAADPKGAVAFIGNSEHWSHTRYNDAAAMGAFNAIRQYGARRLGQILNAARAEMFKEFPDMIYYDPFADESVEFYYYIYALLGDPSMEIWMGPPRVLTVTHPDSIAQGGSLLEVAVFEEDGVTPVEGARVGICQEEDVLGCAWTDASGLARVVAGFESVDQPVRVTVTGTGLAAYRDSIRVVTGDPFVAYADVMIDDDDIGASQGNGDGTANPGEILELTPAVENRGLTEATGVSGTLAALAGASVDVGGAGFPDIPPGEEASSTSPFVVSLDEEAENGLIARFRLEITTDDGAYEAAFDVTIQAPDLRYESHAVGGDGVLEAGDTAELTLTIRNEGSIPATTSEGILRSSTPDLAGVVDSVAAFEAVAVGVTGTQGIPFTVEVTDTAAVGQAAVFTLSLTTEEGYRCETGFSIVLGSVDHRAPMGPDAHGYYAYDNSDTDYPDAVPRYDWVPCSPSYGGLGTRLDIMDNEMEVVGLPFAFTFYGVSYESLLVSDNGWVSFDTTPYFDFFNWSMPNSYGNGAQVAVFWDNLDPEKEYEGEPVGDGIYTLYDAANNRFLVEWSRLGNLRSQHEPEGRPDYDDLQTFQLILFDPLHYTTPTNDGIIRFQYKQIVNNDGERMYATVGIENETEDVGLEYTYTNMYPAASAPLSAGLAIDFTTTPPRYNPFRLARFNASRSELGVELTWEPCDARPGNGYRVYRAGPDGVFDLVRGGRLSPAVSVFLDAGADPDASHAYQIGFLDPVGNETLLGPFAYEGGNLALKPALENLGPNPSAGTVRLRYALPRRGPVSVSIYSVRGRLVRTLVEEESDAGVRTLRWDGRDGLGREAPSGVYFGRLEAGSEKRAVKITLLR